MKELNVLIIVAEQLRRDVLGGQYAPHINRLKEKSVVFERAYCTCPLCAPARGFLLQASIPMRMDV